MLLNKPFRYCDDAFNGIVSELILSKQRYHSNTVRPRLPAVWFGVIFIRHGLYQDGVFKFTVYIPDNYPDGECPVSTAPTHKRAHRFYPAATPFTGSIG